VIAQSAEWGDADGHIRPFQLYRDLGDLATLIEAAFGSELRDARSQIVRDMRQMALMGPLLLAAGSAVAPFAGFVWIEDGWLVGNVSYGREPGIIPTCSISNVAVMPEYRGRGIAGRLLDTTLDHLRREGCRRVFLEVRADNEAAKSLYRRRGFAVYDTVHEQFLPGTAWPVILGPMRRAAASPPSRALHRVRARDGAEIYRLYLSSMPRAVLHARPIAPGRFGRGILWRACRLGRLLVSGEGRTEWVGEAEALPGGGDAGAEAPRHRRIVAYGALTTYLTRRPCELELMVALEHRGTWERPLAETLLARAPVPRLTDARATTPASHPEAIDALAALGFRTQRVLDQMVLELGA
jgi:ribosomal protein S18 acetylase RimI-like enzyme